MLKAIIQYRSLSNMPLGLQEIVPGESYYKDYIINGVVKKTEECHAAVTRVTYYKDPNEQAAEITEQYKAMASLKAIYIREREAYGSYRIETEQIYFRNKQSGGFELQPVLIKWLYNASGDEIAHESFQTNLTTTHPDYRNLRKYYYFGTVSEGTLRPYFISIFDQHFECLSYFPDPEIHGDQDMEEYPLKKALLWMTQLGISSGLQNWYVSDEFLPPPDVDECRK